MYAIQALLKRLVEGDDKEILLAVHSYGAVPACQSISGLERSKRKADGKPGVLVHILFVSAILVEQTSRLDAATEAAKASSWAVLEISKL